MPLIHDQSSNADRLEYMDLGPPSLSRKVLFPHTASNICNVEKIKGRDSAYGEEEMAQTQSERRLEETVDADKSSGGTDEGAVAGQPATGGRPAVVTEEEKALLAAVQTAVALFESRLRAVSAATIRLRCASFGRDLRSDAKENGLKNACDVIVRELQVDDEVDVAELGAAVALGVPQGDRSSGRSREVNSNDVRYTVCTALTVDERKAERNERSKGGDEEIDSEEGNEWEEFENGLRLATHALTSPQETAFLHREIFMERGYMQHGIRLRENDLVIDVGRSEQISVLVSNIAPQAQSRCLTSSYALLQTNPFAALLPPLTPYYQVRMLDFFLCLRNLSSIFQTR
jgi:hypothetical protein